MGNGVDRVEDVELVPIERAKEDALRPDQCPIMAPLSARWIDLLALGMELLGYAPADLPAIQMRGVARHIGARCVEITSWRCDQDRL